MVEYINTNSLPSGGEFDFYGRRYAVYGAGIKIFLVLDDHIEEIATLTSSKISCLGWSHPIQGSYLAAGSGNVIQIWKETSVNVWDLIKTYTEHSENITSIAWSPQQIGINLLAGSSDQFFSILYNDYNDNWQSCKRRAHNRPVFSVSWINFLDIRSFVTAAEDTKVWRWVKGEFEIEFLINETYADVKACTYNFIIAACRNDEVFIWTKLDSVWRSSSVPNAQGYLLQWSTQGNILLACSENLLYVIRQTPNQSWIIAQTISQNGKIKT
jgi:WD40 repeat protein